MKKLNLDNFLKLYEEKTDGGAFKEWGLWWTKEPEQPDKFKNSWGNADYGQDDSKRIKNKNSRFSQEWKDPGFDNLQQNFDKTVNWSGNDNGDPNKNDEFNKTVKELMMTEPDNLKPVNWEDKDSKDLSKSNEYFSNNFNTDEDPNNPSGAFKTSISKKSGSSKKKSKHQEGD